MNSTLGSVVPLAMFDLLLSSEPFLYRNDKKILQECDLRTAVQNQWQGLVRVVVGDLVDAQPARHRRLPAGDPPGGQGPCHGLLLQLREVDQPTAGIRVRPPARVALQTCRQRSLQLAR